MSSDAGRARARDVRTSVSPREAPGFVGGGTGAVDALCRRRTRTIDTRVFDLSGGNAIRSEQEDLRLDRRRHTVTSQGRNLDVLRGGHGHNGGSHVAS